jgi:hypothetical protein
MPDDRLRRIRLLSARFRELQGLRIALVGACMALVVGTFLVVAAVPTDAGAMVALLVSFVPAIPGVRWLNRYYATTFGRQEATRPAGKWPLLLALGYFVVGAWLNATFPAIPPGGPTVATVACLSVWVAIRDWPWRVYYLIAPAAIGIAFAASASGVGAFEPGVTLATIFLALGASMVAIGLLDHSVLVRLVREAREALPSPVPSESGRSE